MNIVILIYIASIVDSLRAFFMVICGIFVVISFFIVVINTDDDFEKLFSLAKNLTIKIAKRFALFAAIFGFLSVITPTERQVYYMSAAYVGTTITNNITSSPEFNKIRLIINSKMDEYIKENNLKDAEIAQ